MTIEKVIKNIKDNFLTLCNNGKIILEEDMPKYPPFDHLKPKEKDLYFKQANTIGIKLIQEGLHHYAVIYFDEMLKVINHYEKDSNKKFNKGMIYGNLGVAKIANGDYDTGIAYLMAGFNEDKLITGDHEAKFLNDIMYQQFEREAHKYIFIKRKGYVAGPVIDTYGHDFMKSLEVDNRLYLMAIVNSLRINLEVLANGNDNKYTKGRILVTLSDLCVFIEDAIKRKVNPRKTVITLKPLLNNYVFSVESWKANVIDNWDMLATSGCMNDLESNIQLILALGNQDAKRFVLLGAIRNFSGHNFDTNGPFFFSHINDIERNIFEAMFYLKDISKL